MNTNTTLTIPHLLYERAKRIAQNQHREVTDVVVEVLEQGLPAMEIEQKKTTEREREKQAFHRLHSDLWQKYPQEYVAVYDGEIVDHDVNRAALLERIDNQYPDVFVLIRQVREEPEIVYDHRSVRWG